MGNGLQCGLIQGENGTGKELVARFIHQHSSAKNNEFVKVDLGAVNEPVFESEFFGQAKGLLSGAKEDKKGCFETAKKGTLFLDEISNIPLALQLKILNVIQTGEWTRLGSAIAMPLDARLISATNVNLHERVQKKLFREDLMYGMNTVSISLPPLRERGEDILILADHFLEIFSARYGKKDCFFTTEARKSLVRHSWPGNVRELQHCIERAVILSSGQSLEADALVQPESASVGRDFQDGMNLSELEKAAVTKAISMHNGNISKAAKELGLTRAALYRRMEKYGL